MSPFPNGIKITPTPREWAPLHGSPTPFTSSELEVPDVNTHDNLADILTKPMLDAKQFHKLRRIIMNDMD